MTTWKLLAITWDWYPSVVIGCAGLLVVYLATLRSRWTSRAWYFIAGVVVLLLALVSPLDGLGDTYLFSAHMAQHMLLLLAVPPLLLLGTPRWLEEWIVRQPPLGRIEHILSRPLLAWSIGTGMVWAWHAPGLYNAALANENIHTLEHLCFLVTGTIFWWPCLRPVVEARLAPLTTVVYLFAGGAANCILGLVLTYAPPGLYPAYVHPVDSLGALPLIRDQWGLSPELDQQLGGILMWVLGMLVYLGAIVGALARWYSAPEEDILRNQIAQAQAE
jgi:cytochrome c oxidase assembly factor CtaG